MVFQRNDSLFFIGPRAEQFSYVPDIVTHKHPQSDNGKWLAYKLKQRKNEFVLKNLLTGDEQRLTSISDYDFDEGEIHYC